MADSRPEARRARQISVLVFSITALLIIIWGVAYQLRFERNRRSETGRQLEAIVDLKITELTQWRKERIGDGLVFYQNREFDAAFSRYSDAGDEALSVWINKSRISYGYDRCFLYSAEGTLLRADPRDGIDDPAIAAAVPAALRSGSVALLDFYLNPINGRCYLAVLVPVAEGRGVLSIRVDPETFLFPFLKSWPMLSETAETFLVRKEGNDAVFLNETPGAGNADLSFRIPLTDISMRAVEQAFAGRSGVDIGVDHRGTPVLSAFGFIPDSPWVLVARMDLQEVDAPGRERRIFLAVLIIALLGAAGAGVMATSRRWNLEMLQRESAAAKTLQESEERYSRIFSEAKVAMLLVDPVTLKIVDANKSAADFYGYSIADLSGKALAEISATPKELLRVRSNSALRMESNDYITQHRRSDGTLVDVEAYVGPMNINGRVCLLTFVHDISSRITAQRERDAFAMRLNHYLLTSPAITYSLRLENGTARWQWISENVTEILGYSVGEALDSDWWFRNIFASDRMPALNGISELTKRSKYAQEYRFYRKNRNIVWIRDEMRLIMGSDGGMEIVGTLIDISDRKKYEEENELKSAALEAADNAVVLTDKDGNIEWANRAYERLSGYSLAEAVGVNPKVLQKSGRHQDHFYREMWETILAGHVWRGEVINKRKNGELYHEEMTITPIIGRDSRIEHFVAIKTDISERISLYERLELSLREKDTLLRDVHHRVFDAMQFLGDAKNNFSPLLFPRISAIAKVHEQFYLSSDLTRVDFQKCIRPIVLDLLETIEVATGKPQIIMECSEIRLNLTQSILAGLFVSEAVANALLSSFQLSSNNENIVRVKVQLSLEKIVTIIILNNGVSSGELLESFGISRMLFEQLGGTLENHNGEETALSLRFPLN